MLKLSARIENTNPSHAMIGVFQNGGKAGVLHVRAENAEQVVGLLNAATRLRDACALCDRAITELMETDSPSSTAWVNLGAARHLARAVVEAATEKKT